MKSMIIACCIFICSCQSSDNTETSYADSNIITSDNAFKFVNHHSRKVNIRPLINTYQAKIPFYLKLSTEGASHNIYLGLVDQGSSIDVIDAHLPLSNDRIYYEIFNATGFTTSGYIDI